MTDTRCFEKGHLKKEAFIMLEHEELKTEERINLAAHLASCSVCSENYTNFLLSGSLMDIPDNLNESILNNTVGSRTRKKYTKSNVIQLFKLTAAAVLAISLYSTGVFNNFYKASDRFSNNIAMTDQYLQRRNNISFGERLNQSFSEFSKVINNFNGVDLYEKK